MVIRVVKGCITSAYITLHRPTLQQVEVPVYLWGGDCCLVISVLHQQCLNYCKSTEFINSTNIIRFDPCHKTWFCMLWLWMSTGQWRCSLPYWPMWSLQHYMQVILRMYTQGIYIYIYMYIYIGSWSGVCSRSSSRSQPETKVLWWCMIWPGSLLSVFPITLVDVNYEPQDFTNVHIRYST